MKLSNLANEIHAAAVEKGFWDVPDAEDKHLAKMISELGEVVQADRAGVMYEVEREGAKPEGVAAELADYAMMLLDYAVVEELSVDEISRALWGAAPHELLDAIVGMDCYELVINLSVALSKMLLDDRLREPSISSSLMAIEQWLQARDIDLWEAIETKLAYNKTRPALHGRRY